MLHSRGLAADNDHVEWLCAGLDLGQCRGEITPVYGGFHHRMWRLETDRGAFAIKQLSPAAQLDDPSVRAHFEASESAADAFACVGVPAIVALRGSAGYLQQRDGEGYLVYHWTDARAAGRNTITAQQGAHVAGLMANMHLADIRVAGLPAMEFDCHSEDNIAALVAWAVQRNVRDARELESRLPDMLKVVGLQSEAIRTLESRLVVSHGDLDHKNVLWTEDGEPLLIDWESVRRLNPTYELILEALDWSGITGNFNGGAFADFLAAYRRAGGVIDVGSIDAAVSCVVGDWVNWMMFNVGRAMDLDHPREHRVGSEQVDLAFSTLLRLERQLPRLFTIVRQQASGVSAHV